ncbi:hypothetical protein CDAR_18301 [Caerostris darwini]|uniref:Uncharacterized protein n=1 Tax=Caerostris darwini TaxID=1538125 RepID=A0AAV4V9J4_9ARAC|nr:hypothetical protein CDAR_18301 [Caerostris darwini]
MPTGCLYRGPQVQMTVEQQTKPHMPKYEILKKSLHPFYLMLCIEKPGGRMFRCEPSPHRSCTCAESFGWSHPFFIWVVNIPLPQISN